MRTVSAFLLALLLVSGCGGDDSPTDPGGGEATLVSSADQDLWTFEKSDGAPLWEDGAFLVEATPSAPPGCDNGYGWVQVRTDAIDVKPYASVRVQFSVRLVLNSWASGSNGSAMASVSVEVREPGSAAVSSYYASWSLPGLGAQVFEEDFDILLDHPEEWDWAPDLELQVPLLQCYALTADGACDDRAVAEISNFRIVATK